MGITPNITTHGDIIFHVRDLLKMGGGGGGGNLPCSLCRAHHLSWIPLLNYVAEISWIDPSPPSWTDGISQ